MNHIENQNNYFDRIIEAKLWLAHSTFSTAESFNPSHTLLFIRTSTFSDTITTTIEWKAD